MSDHHARRFLAVAYWCDDAAGHDVPARVKTAERDNVAELRAPPLRERVGQTGLVVVKSQVGTALDDATLFLAPVRQEVNGRIRGRHGLSLFSFRA